ncbi:unnamed protein product [Nippostrongylus brasiliensis]|uniref:Protein BCCIP homolog (inferred by orthology to a C. elegans protein) n=1 Tax=Nippostrongylus brasiliensis TaxID=27835 RepID=A0A0N4Y233_NIPBR|nr:unnamed protein product [Nippostrongylus brasiliensis]
MTDSIATGKPVKRKLAPGKKKSKKMKKKRVAEPAQVVIEQNEESLSEEASDDDDDDASSGDLIKDSNDQCLDFDIEAFPMEDADRDGIVNMLTQIFLKADIDLVAIADALIKQKPFGLVIGPADDQTDEDDENVVYGVVSVARLNSIKGGPTDFGKQIINFIEDKSRKFALKEFRSAVESLTASQCGLFINERMLNFPTQIVSPSFKSVMSDLKNLKKPYQKYVYIHKVRIADAEPTAAVQADQEKPEKKKKMSKAQKKKLAVQARSMADIIYDNAEDEVLLQLSEGEAQFFDYPVHSEVDSSSKFHILVKDGKSYKPYRRVVIMDSKRLNAFFERVIGNDF